GGTVAYAGERDHVLPETNDIERFRRLVSGRITLTNAAATASLSVIVAETSTGNGYSTVGGVAAMFEICGFVTSAPVAVVNVHADAAESGFPGSLASNAETLTDARYRVVGLRIGTGSIVRAVPPGFQLYVTGIHAKV